MGIREDAQEYYRLANTFYEKGEYEEAIDLYTKAIELDPDYFKAYYNRALAGASLDRYDEALEDIDRVIELDPNYADAYYIKGLCHEHSGMMEEALKDYAKALELRPDFKDVLNHLESFRSRPKATGVASYAEITEQTKELIKNRQYAEALALLEKALQAYPDHIHLLIQRRIISAKVETLSNCEIVCGLEQLKEVFDRLVVTPLKFADDPLYQTPIAKSSKGVILYGPPGCGKTLFVKVLAKQEDIELVEVILSDVLNLYLGESEKRLTQVASKAREIAESGRPVVLFIDEVDALGFAREMTPSPNDASWNRHLISTFLKLLDELRDVPNLIVVGATNRLWTVDEALRRSGRLGSAILYCPPPGRKAREEMFRFFSKDTPGHEKVDFEYLAEQTEWFSGDQIRGICRNVHFEVARDIKRGDEERTAATVDYMKEIAEENPQTLDWIRKVARHYFEGRIEEHEVDKQLKKDIAPFLNGETGSKPNIERRNLPKYIC